MNNPVPRATALRRRWAQEWWQETGTCPFCGERGPYHDPDQGEEGQRVSPDLPAQLPQNPQRVGEVP